MSTDLALPDDKPAAYDVSTAGLLFTPNAMQSMVAVAEFMASGRATTPKHLQGNKGDCLAVVMQAMQWKMNPVAVAQKTHLVNGTLGYEAQLVNAVVNTMAPTKDRINYEWFGDWTKVMGKFEERESKKKVDEDTGKPLKYRVPAWNLKDEADLGVKVWATMKGETAPRELTLLLVQCRVRNSPLWADDPRQQIAYLAVKRWTRLYCPDVLLGVYTPDELTEAPPARDMGDVEEVGKPKVQGLSDEALAKWRAEAGKGFESAKKHWLSMGAELRRLATEDQKKEMQDIATAADKARTVDNAPAQAAKPATASAAADQSTGEVDPEFLAGMERGEARGDK